MLIVVHFYQIFSNKMVSLKMKRDLGVIALHMQVVYVSILFLLALFPIIGQMKSHLVSSEKSSWPNNKVEDKFVNRIIILFIDSLESKFIENPKVMPYLNQAMQMNKTCVINFKSESSTFPGRMKAMFSGIPLTFHDILTYYMGYEDLRDNILSQAKKKGFKIVFYGENTWLKVYPKAFIRSKGVDPLNMTNISEADNLVSKHMMKEQYRNWDIMILHYIGLDHLSSFHGPKSYEITKKIQEMDFIISKINKFMVRQMMLNQNVVLMLSSGKSRFYKYHNEIPFIFINLQCENRNFSISKIDIAPLLSSLFGLPIPNESIGVINSNFYKNFNSVSGVKLIMKNAEHLRKLFIRYGGDNSKLLLYYNISELLDNPKLILNTSFDDLLQGLNLMQLRMSEFLSKKILKLDSFTLGMCITLFIQITILISNDREMIFTLERLELFNLLSFISYMFIIIHHSNLLIPSKLQKTLLAIMIWFNFLFFNWKPQELELTKIMPRNIYSLLLMIQYFGLFTGLISVEEEHRIWYFGISVYLLSSLCPGKEVFLYLFLLHIFFSSMNSTGVIDANTMSINVIFQEGNTSALRYVFSLIAQEFIIVWCTVNIILKNVTSDFVKWLYSVLFNLLLVAYFCVKAYNYEIKKNISSILSVINFLDLLWKTLGCFIFLYFFHCLMNILQPRYRPLRRKLVVKHFLNCAILFIISLVYALIKIENHFIFPFVFVYSSMFSNFCATDELSITSFHNIMGNLCFFYQGYFISITAIDLSSGFIGFDTPSTIISGVLIYFSLFGATLLCTLLLFFHTYTSFFGFQAFRTIRFLGTFTCINILACCLTTILNNDIDLKWSAKVVFVISETIMKSTIIIVILFIEITCSILF